MTFAVFFFSLTTSLGRLCVKNKFFAPVKCGNRQWFLSYTENVFKINNLILWPSAYSDYIQINLSSLITPLICHTWQWRVRCGFSHPLHIVLKNKADTGLFFSAKQRLIWVFNSANQRHTYNWWSTIPNTTVFLVTNVRASSTDPMLKPFWSVLPTSATWQPFFSSMAINPKCSRLALMLREP